MRRRDKGDGERGGGGRFLQKRMWTRGRKGIKKENLRKNEWEEKG